MHNIIRVPPGQWTGLLSLELERFPHWAVDRIYKRTVFLARAAYPYLNTSLLQPLLCPLADVAWLVCDQPVPRGHQRDSLPRRHVCDHLRSNKPQKSIS